MAPKLRPDLAALSGYHSPDVAAEVRLNTNESPYPPPAGFVQELAAALVQVPLHRYPDRQAWALRAALGEYAGVGRDSVFVAHGSNEVLETLLVAYGGPGRKALLFAPTYAMHTHIAEMTGTPLVALRRDDDFCVTAAMAESAMRQHDPDIVFFCNPNNPTGGAERLDAVEVAAAAPDRLVVVDEAYGEFCSTSALRLAARHENVVVCRTMSKAWSLPALRLGYLVAHPALVAQLEPAHLPYHVDAVGQVAGVLALRYEDEMRARVRLLVEQRDALLGKLEAMPGVDVWPSEANFVLFRPEADADDVWRGLVEQSVLVRNFAARPETRNCLRVTVGTPSENGRFLEALGAALEQS